MGNRVELKQTCTHKIWAKSVVLKTLVHSVHMNLEAFNTNYCPLNLLYREEILPELVSEPFPKVLIGPAGVGKTATAKYLVSKGKAVYVEGRSTLKFSLQSVPGMTPTGIYDMLGHLSRQGLPVIFDDIQRMAKNKARFNDWLFAIAEHVPPTPFILVTNMKYKEFIEALYPENLRRLDQHPKCFIRMAPYEVDQLAGIIRNRIVEAGAQEHVEQEAVQYLAGVMKKNGYTLTKVFGMLRYWLSKGTDVTVEVVEKSEREAAVEDWKKQLLDMSDRHHALFFVAVANLQAERAERLDRYVGVSMGEAYQEYVRLAERAGIYPKRLDYMSHVKDELSAEGLLVSTDPQPVQGRGRSSYVRTSLWETEVITKASEVLFI